MQRVRMDTQNSNVGKPTTRTSHSHSVTEPPQTSSQSNPIGIGSRNVSSTHGSTSSASKSHRNLAKSAPVPRFIPPNPPITRPRHPVVDPPSIELPHVADDFAVNHPAVVVDPSDDSRSQTVTMTGLSSSESKSSQVTPTHQTSSLEKRTSESGWGIARSLTNNVSAAELLVNMACPSEVGSTGTGASAAANATALLAKMGKSPTILSIMTGTLLDGSAENNSSQFQKSNLLGTTSASAGMVGTTTATGSSTTTTSQTKAPVLSSRNPGFASTATALSPNLVLKRIGLPSASTAGGPRGLGDEDGDGFEDDEDDDVAMPLEDLDDVADELQFNITLDSE